VVSAERNVRDGRQPSNWRRPGTTLARLGAELALAPVTPALDRFVGAQRAQMVVVRLLRLFE
jgi:hypothetical protein